MPGIKINWMRDTGLALIITPTIMFFLPIYAAFSNPELIITDWEFFLPWVLLPYVLGIMLWILSRRAGAE